MDWKLGKRDMLIDTSNIKGVIFDIDGTLLNSMPVWDDICTRFLISEGISDDDIEPDLDEKAYRMTFEEGCHYLKTHYALSKSENEIFLSISRMIRDFYYYEAPPKEGAVELINKLSEANIPMVLATTGDEDLAMHALDRFGVWGKFSALLTCGQMNTSKREPLIFNEAKRIIEEVSNGTVDYNQIYVFEDSLTALRTVKNMGFTTVGIADDSGKADWNEIESISDIFIYSLNELELY